MRTKFYMYQKIYHLHLQYIRYILCCILRYVCVCVVVFFVMYFFVKIFVILLLYKLWRRRRNLNSENSLHMWFVNGWKIQWEDKLESIVYEIQKKNKLSVLFAFRRGPPGKWINLKKINLAFGELCYTLIIKISQILCGFVLKS